jgi:hypothetical protein
MTPRMIVDITERISEIWSAVGLLEVAIGFFDPKKRGDVTAETENCEPMIQV